VAVVSLLGELPVITADTIRNLRNGSEGPCSEGLKAGLRWIGDRSLRLDEAIEEARRKRGVREYVGWALAALGYGSGDGYGSGYGE
jgi:hypothetical protein